MSSTPTNETIETQAAPAVRREKGSKLAVIGAGAVGSAVAYASVIKGVAREYAHSTGAAFSDPALALEIGSGSGFPVALDDQAPIRGRVGCTGFVARVVRGIDPSRPTPAWMVARLLLAGIRSLGLEIG